MCGGAHLTCKTQATRMTTPKFCKEQEKNFFYFKISLKIVFIFYFVKSGLGKLNNLK